jgi:hypothetical protein
MALLLYCLRLHQFRNRPKQAVYNGGRIRCAGGNPISRPAGNVQILGRRFTYFLQGKALFPQLTKAAKAPGVKISHHRDGSLLRLLCFALKPLFGFIYYNISHFHFEETFLSFFDQNQCPAKNAGALG